MARVVYTPEIDRRVIAYVASMTAAELLAACAHYSYGRGVNDLPTLTLKLHVDPYELLGVERSTPSSSYVVGEHGPGVLPSTVD